MGARRTHRPGWALACAALGFGLVIMHTTAVNIALPSIQDALGGEIAALQWCASAYALALATCILPCGALTDRFGAHRMYLVGMGTFAAASALSASSGSLGMLIAGQAVAGVGAAVVVPTALGLVRAAYPDSGERVRALGKLSLGLATGFGLGPVVGGALVGLVSWRAVFFIDAPAALVLMACAWRFVAPTPPRPGALPALWGAVLGALAVGSLAFTLTEAGRTGWASSGVIAAVAVTAVAGALFARWERSNHAPLLPRRLRAEPTVMLAALIGLNFNVMVYGLIFVLSLNFQQEHGLSAVETGLLFLPQPFGTFTVAVMAGRWIDRHGPRPVLLAGLGLGLASAVVMQGFELSPFPVVVMVCLYAIGVGGGLVVPTLHAIVAVDAPADLVGIAAATLNASRQVGGVLGVAIMGSLVAAAGLNDGAHLALAVAAVTQLAALALVVTRLVPARAQVVASGS